jgi:glycosyltransferase involved in cell wall biosynthesis
MSHRSIRVSVIIPVYNNERTLGACLRALGATSLPRDQYEIITVDDGSTDTSLDVAQRFGARSVRQAHKGAPAARNTGARAAHGPWIAFTDADCLPSRNWLRFLLDRVSKNRSPVAWGAAGKTVGHASRSAAARFVDMTGGLDAETYLRHPRYPWAPTCNVIYRREVFESLGGFDDRYANYEYCDLHLRVRRAAAAEFRYEPRAIVLHQHRSSWRAYWHQQYGYGRGFGQLIWHHRDQFHWTTGRELKAWLRIAGLAVGASLPGASDRALMRRGALVKHLAQRLGFVATYYSPLERARWDTG